MKKSRVIIRHCDEYDPERIRNIVREGMEELGLRPHGRTLVKPNIVCAGDKIKHAYTNPEFIEGVLRALKDRDTDGSMTELAVGERCGITVPTRFAFKESGMLRAVKRVKGVKHYFFEEEPQVEIPLTHEGRLRDYIFTPEPVARADFFVNCPKFKSHPWTTVTFGNKAYIGLQDDRHRLIDHDDRLDEKIADLQYIIQPQFLAIDAIIAGEGCMLTPAPRRLNLIIMGENQCAFDSVCCRIIGIDPFEVPHIRLAHERGFGPLALDRITISGDVTLEEARRRSTGFKVGLIRVEKFFEGTHISAYAGPPHSNEKTDYCWGGCPGALEESIEIIRLADKNADEKIPRIHIVFGAYKGPLDVKDGERVIFIGDCAEWKGTLWGRHVEVENLYRHRSTRDPYTATAEEMPGKLLKIQKTMRHFRGQPYIRLTGCPVSVAEQLMTLTYLGNCSDAIRDWKAVLSYFQWKLVMAAKWLLGHRYQVPGPSKRGMAAPDKNQHH